MMKCITNDGSDVGVCGGGDGGGRASDSCNVSSDV